MHEDALKNFLGVTASISTILQFLTGALVCQKVVNNKSTGDQSALPFVCGCLSTSLWLRYGFFIKDTSIILVNSIGAALFFGYIITFALYSIRKGIICRQVSGCALSLTFILIYIQNVASPQVAQRHLGLICTLMTILFFGAPLVSLMHVLKVRSTESLPFPIILSSFLVSAQWMVYGVLLGDPYVQIPNFLGCVLTGFQLCLFYCFSQGSKGYSSELI
ncbi:sugar transporter SWEET1 [Coccinella septempunctata]|uniref:sugar transporter SWEET1 n=1 Tax=Coccinella septempunctata TaxID=41139 RepID=UPI001D06A6A1|nr:sugar transporter SWEET1 [Coccinella septempunctata]